VSKREQEGVGGGDMEVDITTLSFFTLFFFFFFLLFVWL